MILVKLAKVTSVLALSAGIAAASASTAGAQSRSERVAERRAAMEQRLQSLESGASERMAQRTEILEKMATTTPEMIEARLSDAEEAILGRLFDADPDWIEDQLNKIGERAETVLSNRDLLRLTEEQQSELLVAAGRAATITDEEVEELLVDGALKVDDYFDNTDPENIASTLNEIGAEALDLQEVLQEAGQDVKERRNTQEPSDG